MAEDQQAPATAAVDRVHARLRQGILDGTYAQGTRLGEAELAEALGVSRTPVREALRRLSSEGLLSTSPNKGARVRTWSVGELSDIFDLRVLLEGHAAAVAASRVTGDQVRQMTALVERMDAAAAHPQAIDFDALTALNLAFHAAIADASGNSLLPDIIHSLVHVPVVLRTYRLYSPVRLRESLDQHRALLGALAAGDPVMAEAIMRVHILSARPALLGPRGDRLPR